MRTGLGLRRHPGDARRAGRGGQVSGAAWELLRRGWTNEEIAKLAGENMLRVLASVERVSARLRSSRKASEATIEELDGIIEGRRTDIR